MKFVQLPIEKLKLLFPIRVPGGEISEVTVRPITNDEFDEMKADESGDRMFAMMARAAGLSESLGPYISNSDLRRIAHATGRLRVQYCEEGWADQ